MEKLYAGKHWADFSFSRMSRFLKVLYGMENGLTAGNGEKMETRWQTTLSLTGSKWPKNRLEMVFQGNFPFFHFWASFLRRKWFFIFSPFPGFRPFCIPYRPDRIPILEPLPFQIQIHIENSLLNTIWFCIGVPLMWCSSDYYHNTDTEAGDELIRVVTKIQRQIQTKFRN